jgi:hypothetical protein
MSLWNWQFTIDPDSVKTAIAAASVVISIISLLIARRAKFEATRKVFNETKDDIAIAIEENEIQSEYLRTNAQLLLDEFDALLKQWPKLKNDQVAKVLKELEGVVHIANVHASDRFSTESYRQQRYSRGWARKLEDTLYRLRSRSMRLNHKAWELFLQRGAATLAELKDKTKTPPLGGSSSMLSATM